MELGSSLGILGRGARSNSVPPFETAGRSTGVAGRVLPRYLDRLYWDSRYPTYRHPRLFSAVVPGVQGYFRPLTYPRFPRRGGFSFQSLGWGYFVRCRYSVSQPTAGCACHLAAADFPPEAFTGLRSTTPWGTGPIVCHLIYEPSAR